MNERLKINATLIQVNNQSKRILVTNKKVKGTNYKYTKLINRCLYKFKTKENICFYWFSWQPKQGLYVGDECEFTATIKAESIDWDTLHKFNWIKNPRGLKIKSRATDRYKDLKKKTKKELQEMLVEASVILRPPNKVRLESNHKIDNTFKAYIRLRDDNKTF